MFERTLFAGWGDVDFNSHMKNTAYLDKAADTRMMFFAENGFSSAEFMRLNIGPVVMKDEITYYREMNLLEEFKVMLMLAGAAEDGTRFMLRNEFFKSDGLKACKLTSMGGWLDLKARKLITPPEELFEILMALPKTEDFAVLPSSIKS